PDFLSAVRNQPGDVLSSAGDGRRLGPGNGGAVPLRGPGIQRDGAPRRWRFSAQGARAAVVFPRGAVLSPAERLRRCPGQGLYVFETARPGPSLLRRGLIGQPQLGARGTGALPAPPGCRADPALLSG